MVPFCRRYFKCIFLNWMCGVFSILQMFTPVGQIVKIPVLVHSKAWFSKCTRNSCNRCWTQNYKYKMPNGPRCDSLTGSLTNVYAMDINGYRNVSPIYLTGNYISYWHVFDFITYFMTCFCTTVLWRPFLLHTFSLSHNLASYVYKYLTSSSRWNNEVSFLRSQFPLNCRLSIQAYYGDPPHRIITMWYEMIWYINKKDAMKMLCVISIKIFINESNDRKRE